MKGCNNTFILYSVTFSRDAMNINYASYVLKGLNLHRAVNLLIHKNNIIKCNIGRVCRVSQRLSTYYKLHTAGNMPEVYGWLRGFGKSVRCSQLRRIVNKMVDTADDTRSIVLDVGTGDGQSIGDMDLASDVVPAYL